jgi:hypothetical protein
MRRRKLQWVVGLVVVALVALAAFVLWPRPDPALQAAIEARATFGRLKPGMTMAEMTTILGPSGNYSSTDTREYNPAIHYQRATDWFGDPTKPALPVPLNWDLNTHIVRVFVDRSGKAVCGNIIFLRPKPVGPIERLIRWSKEQWRKWFP